MLVVLLMSVCLHISLYVAFSIVPPCDGDAAFPSKEYQWKCSNTVLILNFLVIVREFKKCVPLHKVAFAVVLYNVV